MKRTGLLLIGLLLGARADASDGWSSLWRTPDQRGEQLLRRGDAAAAAKTYSDPRRKAYAELQAGDYSAASRDLAGFDDSDSHYNQGNALAKSGKLEDSIKAYDLALARNPGNADAKHNRDLVELALHQQQASGKQDSSDQKSSQKQSSGDQNQQQAQGQQPNTGNRQGQSSGKDSKADDAAQNQQGTPLDGKDETQKNAQNSAGQTLSPQNKTDAQHAASKADSSQSPANPANQSHTAQDRAAGSAGDQKPADASSQAGSKTAQSTSNESGNEAAQARADAQAGLRQPPQNTNTARAGNLDGKAQSIAEVKPMTEQQLAQEQWLRQIPDDPGGLLRRKFMIEHLMRQQQPPP